MSIHVGDVLIGKTAEEEYASRHVPVGETQLPSAEQSWVLVTFGEGACYLVIDKFPAAEGCYFIECVSLENAYCFKLRGDMRNIATVCHILRKDKLVKLLDDV